jgi:hypothetical protein
MFGDQFAHHGRDGRTNPVFAVPLRTLSSQPPPYYTPVQGYPPPNPGGYPMGYPMGYPAAPPQGYPAPAPYPYAQVPYGASPPITAQPTGTKIQDRLFLDKLAAIRNFELRQGNALLEAITLGAWANIYSIGDKDRPTQVRCPVLPGNSRHKTCSPE